MFNFIMAEVEISKFDTMSLIQYIVDILIIMIIMCILVYLSFSIVKKNQVDALDSHDIEQTKIKEKIRIKNQIEIIQSGIVMVDQETYIIPARRVLTNYIYDESMLKIKHLNSLNNDGYDALFFNDTSLEEKNNDTEIASDN